METESHQVDQAGLKLTVFHLLHLAYCEIFTTGEFHHCEVTKMISGEILVRLESFYEVPRHDIK